VKSLKNIVNFYVNSNLHVALACFSLVEITRSEFGLEKDASSKFAFFATVLAYNFIRLVQLDKIHASISLWIRSRSKVLILVNLIAFAGLIYSTVQIDFGSMLLLLPFLLATVFYVYPGSGRFQGLRKLAGMKLLLISLTWAGVTVLFPLEVAGREFDNETWIVFAQRFLFVFAITIPFDIRDLQIDGLELGTLPQTIGVFNSEIAALAALVLFSLLELIRLDFDLTRGVPALLTALLAAALVLGASIYQKRFYSAFWIEALPIFWLGLVVLEY
jgi:hypothetical protein